MRSMTTRAGLTGALALTVLGATLNAPAQATPASQDTAGPQDTATAQADAGQDLLPADVLTKLKAALAAAGVEGQTGATTATACGDTNFTVWIRQHTQGWTKTDRKRAATMATLTELDSVYYPQIPTKIGDKGQYTGAMVREMHKLRGFWNFNGSNVGLSGLHPGVLTSQSRLTRLLTTMGDMSHRKAAAQAAAIVQYVHQPKFQNGNHPFFTLNAFSTPASRYGSHHLSPRVVMGDGILRAMADLGWGNTAPQEVLAHEYGHQAEYATGVIDARSDKKTTTAQSRYIELMADAYSGYFLRHTKGENHGWGTMSTYLQVAYATGDCNFTSQSHHGTPDQRMAAATWGSSVAGHDGTKVRPTKQFANSFRGAYKRIVSH